MLGHLRKLLRSPTLSARDVQAAAGERPGGASRPLACGQLIRHLLLSFLLWAPAGHAIAREVISHVSVPVFSVLIFIRISPRGPPWKGVCTRMLSTHGWPERRWTAGTDPRACPGKHHVTEETMEAQRKEGTSPGSQGESEVSCLPATLFVSAASPGSPRSRLWEDAQCCAEKPWLIGRAVPKPREAPRGEGEEQSLRGLARCLFRK